MIDHEENKKEATRCLKCKKSRCSSACAVHTDVPEAMKLFLAGRKEEAAKMLFDNNPLSAITCQVCDWKRMCFGHCILNVKKVPIRWYEVEQEISSLDYLKSVRLQCAPDNGKKVSIIGAGPAGIVAAIELLQKGFAVTMFDEHERVGGVLRYGIPEFRLDNAYIDEYERILKEAGLKFKGRVQIGKNISLKVIRSLSDAVLIATGADVPRRMNIPGEDNPHVIPALKYLDNPDAYVLGRKVFVVGGGNVAMDASRTAAKNGHDTTLIYRKDFDNMPANTIEVEEAMKDGVQFRVLQTPVEIKSDGDRNIAVMKDCQTVVKPDGQLSTEILDGTEREVEFDDMIIAVSETVDFGIFGQEKPETIGGNGCPKVNGIQQTSFSDVFLAGDFLYGPKTVVMAVHSAKIAVQGIVEYLS